MLQANQMFGASLALEGGTLAVGSPWLLHERGGFRGIAGGVYIFTRSGASWTQQTIIKPDNLDIGDLFGREVDLFGNTLVVSSPGEASNATGINGDEDDNSVRGGSGAVYVFTGAGDTWTQDVYIKSDVLTTQFGRALALYDDTLATNSLDERNVYIYSRVSGSWAKQAQVIPNVTLQNYNQFFGYSLDLQNDTLVVGAPNNASGIGGINGDQTDVSEPSSGAVYLFARDGDSWSEQAFIKAEIPSSNSFMGEGFGGTVALSGDTLAIVAPENKTGATGVNGDPESDGMNGGAVYIFD